MGDVDGDCAAASVPMREKKAKPMANINNSKASVTSLGQLLKRLRIGSVINLPNLRVFVEAWR